ncbi:putative cytochrome P450 [Rosa chinensis]|uniref:Putative cytochrome P450 n=1 Tax=Rosa chinensis TaxID=74649 RepID=A0A2P6R2F1_ROSCH|nr:putative cytochrome P450 [Rosa chinensis]
MVLFLFHWSMIPQMIASAETMLGRWKNHVGQEIEVFQEFRLLTAEVISRTAFGSSYLQGFEMLMKLSSLLVNFDLKLKLPGIRISIDDIVDECKSFYFAGQETVNTLLSWTVFLLALHNDWQEEARKEVLQLFGKETPNPNDLSKLKTMSMIINESLRLYSPILYVTRSIERTVRLGKLIVPADVELIIPFLAIQHDLQFWGQDAHLFKPDRFSEGVAKATNNNMATFIPFGMGPRNCVGLHFGTT